MIDASFIAEHSKFFENLLEHRFLFDLRRHLLLTGHPRLLNVLKSEVDIFGFDLVLSVDDRSYYVQMKTRSGKPPSNPYDLSDSLWNLSNACTIWMLYDPITLEPSSYNVLGLPMPPIEGFQRSSRKGFHKVKMQHANHKALKLADLGALLFP